LLIGLITLRFNVDPGGAERETIERVPVFSAGIAARVVVGGVLLTQVYYGVPFQLATCVGIGL